jgi:hypothetical protein
MDELRVAVTLTNGRSHVLDLPDEVTAEDAAAVLRGERPGSEIGWELGDGDWLPFGTGTGWVCKRTVAEITLVDFSGDKDLYIDEPYR